LLAVLLMATAVTLGLTGRHLLVTLASLVVLAGWLGYALRIRRVPAGGGWSDGPDGPSGAGVREPRRPRPKGPAGVAERALPIG
jgi:hypothetical protein